MVYLHNSLQIGGIDIWRPKKKTHGPHENLPPLFPSNQATKKNVFSPIVSFIPPKITPT